MNNLNRFAMIAKTLFLAATFYRYGVQFFRDHESGPAEYPGGYILRAPARLPRHAGQRPGRQGESGRECPRDHGPGHRSYDSAAYSALTAAGAGAVWSSTSFTYTHQKTITVDNKESYISTGNFDMTYYATSRDYGVFDTDAADVSAITAVFNADYAHSSITPSDGTDLVWLPTDSQTRLLGLINGATRSLDVEQEESATPPWSTPSSRP
jgi:hypothetical protein